MTNHTAIDCRDGFSGDAFPCSWSDGKATLYKPGLAPYTFDAASVDEARDILCAMGYRA